MQKIISRNNNEIIKYSQTPKFSLSHTHTHIHTHTHTHIYSYTHIHLNTEKMEPRVMDRIHT